MLISLSVAKCFSPMSTSNSLKCVQFFRANIVGIRLYNQIILVTSLLTNIFVNFHIYIFVRCELEYSATSFLPNSCFKSYLSSPGCSNSHFVSIHCSLYFITYWLILHVLILVVGCFPGRA